MDYRVADRIHTVEEYFFSKKLREIADLRSHGKDILNLGIGSPDLPPHQSVISELIKGAENPKNHGYQSYRGLPELKNAFAEWMDKYFSVSLDSETEILPLIGSKEGIMHLSMTFLQKGDAALVPNPGYPTYSSATKLAGANPVMYNLKAENGYLPDYDELEQLVKTHQIKLMWINYPHMPTGAEARIEDLQKLVDFARRNNILLCHDNPYAFVLTSSPKSVLSIPGAKEVCVELHSLSKSHNMAGWRVGALMGSSEVLNEVIKFKSNMDSGMFKATQLAASQALRLPQNWYDHLNSIYSDRKKIVKKIFETLQCTVEHDQVGLFLWARIPEGYKNAEEFSNRLLYEVDVFITPGFIFGSQGDRYARISLCANEELLNTALHRVQSLKTKSLLS